MNQTLKEHCVEIHFSDSFVERYRITGMNVDYFLKQFMETLAPPCNKVIKVRLITKENYEGHEGYNYRLPFTFEGNKLDTYIKSYNSLAVDWLNQVNRYLNK